MNWPSFVAFTSIRWESFLRLMKSALTSRRVPPQKRAQLIDRLLTDPRHADHWVSYWQDVLAENPRLVKPTLNNTGPFRYWIHEALSDNKPFDRFVTELVTFAGGSYSGGAGGFRLATQNDVPMAAKAHVIGTAFLGLEMKCARCHDAPFHSLEQRDLFSIAAMLKGSALKVPKTSTVPKEFFARLHSRESRIKVTLDPNSPVIPAWPFPNLAPTLEADPSFSSSAERLAYQLTRPENRRFARVIVNRIWKRYFGQGFVEPADDWDNNEPSHPDLLEYLARDFVVNNYDLHRLSRLILNSAKLSSHLDQQSREGGLLPIFRSPPATPPQRRTTGRFPLRSHCHAPLRRRTHPRCGWHLSQQEFSQHGTPPPRLEFISLSTERDRPSLTLPLANPSSPSWKPTAGAPTAPNH